jgi:hypothetical protein
MISDTLLFYILTIVLIYVFESRLIPQLLVFAMIVYNIYTSVIVAFNPIDVLMTALTILYCLGHVVNSIAPSKEDD